MWLCAKLTLKNPTSKLKVKRKVFWPDKQFLWQRSGKGLYVKIRNIWPCIAWNNGWSLKIKNQEVIRSVQSSPGRPAQPETWRAGRWAGEQLPQYGHGPRGGRTEWTIYLWSYITQSWNRNKQSENWVFQNIAQSWYQISLKRKTLWASVQVCLWGGNVISLGLQSISQLRSEERGWQEDRVSGRSAVYCLLGPTWLEQHQVSLITKPPLLAHLARATY